ncbi:MAG: porin [Chitinophagaceae bacterium]
MTQNKIILICLLTIATLHTKAQQNSNPKSEAVRAITNTMKFSGNIQTWARMMQYNTGSTIFGYKKDKGADVGIRRVRLNLTGTPTEKITYYVQASLNNFNSLSDRKLGLFISDANADYKVYKNHLDIGMGLSAWSGLSRFSSPSTISFLGIDGPLFLQTTNDVTDQFFRKLSVYAKGKINHFDYRIVLAQPMAIQKSNSFTSIGYNANFSARPAKLQTNAYFQYQFFDIESNTTAYTAGTYIGKKKVFNIGLGYIYQPKAMWQLGTANDTIENNLLQAAIDVFYDAPIGKNGEALSVYGCYLHSDFGTNYYRNTAVMNPTNGLVGNHLNGSGNGYPAVGTGESGYLQAGYKLKDDLIKSATLMPYASVYFNKLQRFVDPIIFYDLGLNVLLNGHFSKITLAYQNRPLMNSASQVDSRKSALLIQYQTAF